MAAELTDKVGLDSQQVDGIQEFLDLKSDTPERLLDQADAMLKFGALSHQGIQELRELLGYLDAFQVPRSAWTLDFSVVRGLGYYTGTVFETTLLSLPQFGSVCGGGRYDDLVARFAPMDLSGVGMSIGIDRLFAALDELGLIPTVSATAKVAILDFDPECRPDVLTLVSSLRTAGISTLLYLGHDESLKAQLGWAVKSSVPYVVILGKSEREKGVAQLKDMTARTQEEVSLVDLAEKLK